MWFCCGNLKPKEPFVCNKTGSWKCVDLSLRAGGQRSSCQRQWCREPVKHSQYHLLNVIAEKDACPSSQSGQIGEQMFWSGPKSRTKQILYVLSAPLTLLTVVFDLLLYPLRHRKCHGHLPLKCQDCVLIFILIFLGGVQWKKTWWYAWCHWGTWWEEKVWYWV